MDDRLLRLIYRALELAFAFAVLWSLLLVAILAVLLKIAGLL